jgi:integrase
MAKRERGDGGLFRIKGSQNWYAQIYKDGKPYRISSRLSVKEEAKDFLKKLMLDATAGKPFIGDVQKIHYGDLRAGLLHNYIERGNKSLQILADGTETIWGLKALDGFFEYKSDKEPGVPVTKITTDAARKFTQERLEAGITNSTINLSLAALRRMLNIAHEDSKIPVVPKIRLLKPNAPRKGFLEQKKFDELLGHISTNLKPLILLLYYCGLRLGEALQIDWSQVDLDRALIHLEDEQTKSGEGRTVPLPDILVDILQTVEPKHGTVFDGTNLRMVWQKACVAAKLGILEERRYTGLLIHDLRRSAIKNLTRAGVPQNVAMKISGHKTISVFQRYNIVDETDLVEAMRKVQDSKNLVAVSESSVRVPPERRIAKR